VAKNAIKTMKWWQKTPPKYQNGGRKRPQSSKVGAKSAPTSINRGF